MELNQSRSLGWWAVFLGYAGLLVACSGASTREQKLEATVMALQTRVVQTESERIADHPPQTPAAILATSNFTTTSFITNTIGILIDQYMHDQEKPFSGTIMVVRDGRVLIKKGYGLAEREHNVPNTPDTKFAIGSITKSFTAVAIMILQEQGILSVKDSICNFISECPEIWEPITLHHLLTHSSGIRNSGELDVVQRDEINLCQEYEPEDIIPYFKEHQLLFEPGDKFHYSNPGYFLLGYVIEKVSNGTYEDFIQMDILQPLDMTDTGYDHDSKIVKNRASGYSLDRIRNQYTNAACLDVSLEYSAGALYSTVDDLYRWDQALYSAQLLSDESVNQIFATSATYPKIFGDSTAGYGWVIANDLGHRVIEHGGQVNGFTAYLARYPDDQVTVIVLSNYDEEQTGRISRNLSRIVFEEK